MEDLSRLDGRCDGGRQSVDREDVAPQSHQADRHLEIATRAGDFIFVAGMRGIDPKTDRLISDHEARIRQAFLNMKLSLIGGRVTTRCRALCRVVTDMFRFRPVVNKVQAELWGDGSYPPRIIIEVHRFNQNDILEFEGMFYAPVARNDDK